MSGRIAPLLALLALGASALALAQNPTDLTFTATGTRCEDIHWSPRTLELYPRITRACQAVVQREGRYFVVFSGTVSRVARRGRDLTVEFKDGDRVTLNPPSDLKVDIEGHMTRVRDLQRGQALTFYVPQDRFVAEVPEGERISVPIPITGWEPQPITRTPHPAMAPHPVELPKTATERGLLALGGLALVLVGAGLASARYRRGAR